VWIPQDGARNLAEEPWASWIKDGWLTPTPGEITDTETVYKTIAARQEQFSIASVAVDPNNAREFGERIIAEHGAAAYWFGQVAGKYNEPLREFLDMLHEGRLIHGGNPVLAWFALNLVLKTDYRDYVMPAKKLAKDKIDGVCALVMGLSECMFAEQQPAPTGRVYAV